MTTLTIEASDWGQLGLEPSTGWVTLKPTAVRADEGTGMVETTEEWTVRIPQTGATSTEIPDATPGTGVLLNFTLAGLGTIAVAGYPTGPVSLATMLTHYVVDKTTLEPSENAQAAWDLTLAQVTAQAGIATGAAGDALGSAEDAEQARLYALGYRTDAQDARDAAVVAKTAAQDSAGAAASSAGTAASAASTATTKAAEALGHANDAEDTLADLQSQKGSVNGIAPINGAGKVLDASGKPLLTEELGNSTYGMRGSLALPVAHILVAVHQSNNDGRATDFDAARIDFSDPRVLQYGRSGAYAGVISLATEPLASTIATQMGPSLTLARRLVRDISANDIVLIVPTAVGGTPYLGTAPFGTWDHRRADATDLAAAAVVQVTAACAAAEAMGYKPVVQWVTSIHGESDGDNGTTGANYAAADDFFLDYLTQNLPHQATNMVFVRGGMVPEYLSTGTRAVIRQAQIDLPRRRVLTAYTDGIPDAHKGDGNHYRAKGARGLGNALASAVARASLNILGTDAVVPAGVAPVQSGTSIIVGWAAVLGRATDFHVRYRANGGAWTTLTRAQSIDLTATIPGLALGDSVDVQVNSQNEAGTSGWSTTATLVVQQLPAALTGLAPGTATYSAQPLSWAASARAVAYRVRYRLHSSGGFITFGTVSGLTATVTGLADGVAYDYEVVPVGAAGDGSAGGLSNAFTASLPVLLDGLTAVAFDGGSTRKLRSGYTGAALRIRRDNDDAEFDIGFVGSNLDVSDLLAKTGSASAYVTKVYDQGTTGTRHRVQTVKEYQPIIVRNGVAVAAPNGVVMWELDGVDDHLIPVVGLYAAGASTWCGVIQSVQGAANGRPNGTIADESRVSSASPQYNPVRQAPSGAQLSQFISNDAGTALLALSSSAVSPEPFNNGVRQITVVDTGASFRKYIDGTASTALAYTRTGVLTLDSAAEGIRVRGTAMANPWLGRFGEVVRFTSSISDADRATVLASQKAYFGTP